MAGAAKRRPGIAARAVPGGWPSGLRTKARAEELVQQTFLEVQRDFACFGGQDKEELLAWLKSILRNHGAKTLLPDRESARLTGERSPHAWPAKWRSSVGLPRSTRG